MMVFVSVFKLFAYPFRGPPLSNNGYSRVYTDVHYGADNQQDPPSWIPHESLEDMVTTLRVRQNWLSTTAGVRRRTSKAKPHLIAHPRMPKAQPFYTTLSPRHHPYSLRLRRQWQREVRLRQALSMYPLWLIEILHILSDPGDWPLM